MVRREVNPAGISVCIGVGKRTKQQAVYDAEDSGVRANADGKRKKRGDGEGARSDQDATSVAQIFQQGIKTIIAPPGQGLPCGDECHARGCLLGGESGHAR